MTEPILYDPRGTLFDGGGLAPADYERLAPRLAAARDAALADVDLFRSGAAIPAEKSPLDAAFIDLPERLLEEHQARAEGSVIGSLCRTADRLAGACDRVVVLGIGGSYMGARALMDALCHPYHNELDRAARVGRPRVYFQGNNVDNDALAGLLDLMPRELDRGDPQSQFGVIVISKSGGTIETAVAFRQFAAALARGSGDDRQLLGELIVPVTGPTGKLRDLAGALGCEEVLEIPDGVGGRFSILTPVGLLPAAVLGLDPAALLAGAAEMNRRFREEPLGNNPVLDYVATCHLMEELHGADTRILSLWSSGLEATGLWYDQLLAESLGKHERGALPLTVVNTRDLHSRGQQHQEGPRDKLITNVIVREPRRDPLAVGRAANDQDQLNALAEKTLPEILSAATQGTNQAYAEDHRPTADLILPQLDEHALGQFFQMMMLATVVEGRLIDINPYGQPGVEAYKRHMRALLETS